MTNLYAALELGTSRTVLAVGAARPGERLKILQHAEIPSSGVKKSQIINIKQTAQSIKSVISEIQNKQGKNGDNLTIGNAFLVLSGSHIKVDHFCASTQIAGGKVSNSDIEQVVNDSRMRPLQNDREILDIIEQTYKVDTIGGIDSPKGMSGNTLHLDTLHIHGSAARINDAKTAADEANLELRDPLFAAVCAADAVLNDSEKQHGALVIDLGGGTTGYAVYYGGYLATANSIGVGGEHVSSDISHAFQTTHAQAEDLKKNEASAFLTSSSTLSPRVKLSGSSPLMETRSISRRALDTVVNLRMKELIGIIKDEIHEHDLLHRLQAGVVLTGGGAAMRGLAELVRKEFRLNVRIGKPIYVDGFSETSAPHTFAAISGALMYAHKNYERKPLFSIFKGLFK